MSFTPAQVAAIKGWTEQRDALLADILLLTVELDEKQKAATEAGANVAALDKREAEVRGRLSVLDELETLRRTSLPLDIAELEARKTRLETECTLIGEKTDGAHTEYGLVSGAMGLLMAANDTMKDQAAIVDSVAGQIIETSKTFFSEAKGIMVEIEAISDRVIAKGNENIAQTGIVIEKMPKFIFNMQKPIPVRRTYPNGHPNAPVSAE